MKNKKEKGMGFMMKLNLIGSKEDRQYVMEQNNAGEIDLVDILKKHGKVVDYMTESMVAKFYRVPNKTIDYQYNTNKDELDEYGCRAYKKSEILNLEIQGLENIPNRGLRLYPIKAVILIGMMLTESDVAAKLRRNIMDKIFNPEKQPQQGLSVEQITQIVTAATQAATQAAIAPIMDRLEKLIATKEAPKTRTAKTRTANFSTLPTVTKIAKPFGMTGTEANKNLEENGIIRRSDNGKGSILNEEYEDRWGITIYEDGKEPYVRYFELGVNSITKIFSRIINASEQEQLNLF